MHLQVHFFWGFSRITSIANMQKVWIIPKGKFWYFKWFCLWILQLCCWICWENQEPCLVATWIYNHKLCTYSFNPIGFEESYILQSCIKIWIIPKDKFWYFKCFCMCILHTFRFVKRMKKHIGCLHASEHEHPQRQVLVLQFFQMQRMG